MEKMMNNVINKYKLTEINEKIGNYDLFIGSCSFEDRCLSFAKNIDKNKITHAILSYTSEYLEYLNNNKTILENIFLSKVKSIEVRHSDPIFSIDNIRQSILNIIQYNNVVSILIDITTFTHETLLMLIRLLQKICPGINIDCVYSNASKYDSEHSRNAKWLSKGIKEIRSVLGYSGNIVPTKKTHLIVIVGYEYERATSIINTIEPDSIALCYGRASDATTEKDKDANKHYLQLVKKMAISYNDIIQFEIKCNNPFDTCEILLNHVNSVSGKNILILPLNNKISTVGASFAALKNSNIQLCYAPALIYNYSNYSSAGDSCYIFNISETLKRNMGD
jgi:hypothetical protein